MKGLLLLLAIGFILFLLWDGGQNYVSLTGATPEEETQVREILTMFFWLAVIISPFAYVLGRRHG